MAMIDGKPLFVDNQEGNTLARANTSHLQALRQNGNGPDELCVATCYFNHQGLELLSRELRQLPRIRLLLGAEPTPEALLPRRAMTVPCSFAALRRARDPGIVPRMARFT